ncbi:hypothetical protein Tco_0907884 [Tanacetum coccineum]|uniref:Transposase n=1 Tax=Tanacetum coccineum TaxID=301880 RepID=A0ABQ5CS01_9ASTR
MAAYGWKVRTSPRRNGKIGGKNNREENVEFLDDMLISDSNDHIGSIIHETYPDSDELVDMINDRVGGYYLRNTAYGH